MADDQFKITSVKRVPEGDIYGVPGSIEDVKKDIKPRRLGWRIFFSVMILTGLSLLLVTAYGIVSYPRLSDVQVLLPAADGPARLQGWKDLRADWVQQMTTLAQVFIFGSTLPLMGTIAGYLLGERARDKRTEDEID